jgi:hypothetical protein
MDALWLKAELVIPVAQRQVPGVSHERFGLIV